MWRSNYIINRACFTPLEVVATEADAGIDKGQHDAKTRFPGVYQVDEDKWLREILPGNDIQLLVDSSHREMGVVELSQLADTPFDLGTAQNLNRRFFPELDAWLSGNETTPFPVLISDYVTMVERVSPTSDLEAITKDEILESARRFTTYASNQIETNFQLIQQSRQGNMSGYSVKWSKRTKMFAEQLGRTLEEDIASQVIPVDTKSKELELQEESNRLKREELEFLKLKFEAESKVKQVTEKKDK